MKNKKFTFAILILMAALLLGACTAVDSKEIEESVLIGDEEDEDEQDSELSETEEEEIDEEVEVEVELDEAESDETTEEVADDAEESESSSTANTIEFVDEGFDPDELTISVGDTVEFLNVRSGDYTQAMLVGAQGHTEIRSGLLETGESYSYTFTEADEYVFVDGILTTYTLKIIVE